VSDRRGGLLIGMANSPTYSILFTPGHNEVRLTLVVCQYVPHHGRTQHVLESVWAPWENCMSSARRLVAKGVQMASDSVPEPLPFTGPRTSDHTA
jgi:hypothetical protein